MNCRLLERKQELMHLIASACVSVCFLQALPKPLCYTDNYKDTDPSPLQVAGRNSTEAKLVAEAALNEWANDERSLLVDFEPLDFQV